MKYLKLVFEDLCARDNGNTRASFGLYTFLKVFSINLIFFSMLRGSPIT